MKLMRHPRNPRRPAALVWALYANAALLAAVLVAVLSRGNGWGVGSPAFAAPQMQPIAGGGGIFLMPAQFSTNTWGCYVMDIDTQNICAYQYLPGANQLRFVASRNFREDTRLPEWNTSPPLADIARLNRLGKGGIRGAPPLPVMPDEAPAGPPQPADLPHDPNEPKDSSARPEVPASAPATGAADPSGTNRPSDITSPPDQPAGLQDRYEATPVRRERREE